MIEVSYGELFDKVTILEIKEREIHDEQKHAHVITELEILHKSVDAVLKKHDDLKNVLLALKEQLGTVNWRLWQVEDAIRAKEAQQSFDAEFIQLARSIYKLNQQRAELKTKISHLLHSNIVEVKSYAV
jgi:predicted  nucleic acid-binding Zn-ribbon protein